MFHLISIIPKDFPLKIFREPGVTQNGHVKVFFTQKLKNFLPHFTEWSSNKTKSLFKRNVNEFFKSTADIVTQMAKFGIYSTLYLANNYKITFICTIAVIYIVKLVSNVQQMFYTCRNHIIKIHTKNKNPDCHMLIHYSCMFQTPSDKQFQIIHPYQFYNTIYIQEYS